MVFEKAAIFGATGGIGAALCRLLADRGAAVLAGSRSGEAPKHPSISPFAFDLEDEGSIASAAAAMSADPPALVVVATGVLTLADGIGPERSLKQLDGQAMQRLFLLNTTGPALIAKHVLPLLPRAGRSLFAVLSARVGSIGGNHTGGWHSYRASKAALNMLVRNFAIEMNRTHPDAIVVGLHPGTVDTELSRPFQANLPKGQLTARRQAATNLVGVIERLSPRESGGVYDWQCERVPD